MHCDISRGDWRIASSLLCIMIISACGLNLVQSQSLECRLEQVREPNTTGTEDGTAPVGVYTPISRHRLDNTDWIM